MPSLVEIARNEPQSKGIIIFDSTLTGIDKFLEAAELADDYTGFDMVPINEARSRLKEALAFVREFNTWTTAEAKNELEDFRQRLEIMQKRVNAPYLDQDMAITQITDTNLFNKQRRLAGLVERIKEFEELFGKKVLYHHNPLFHPHETHYGKLQDYVEKLLIDKPSYNITDRQDRRLRAEFFAIALYYAINQNSLIAFATNRQEFGKSFDQIMGDLLKGIELAGIFGVGRRHIDLNPNQFRHYRDLSRTGNFELYSGKYEAPTQAVTSRKA